MTPDQLRRVATGSRIGWLPTGEAGSVVQKLDDGMIVEWVNGTIGKVTWDDARYIAHAARRKRPLLPRRLPQPPDQRASNGQFIANGSTDREADA